MGKKETLSLIESLPEKLGLPERFGKLALSGTVSEYPDLPEHLRLFEE